MADSFSSSSPLEAFSADSVAMPSAFRRAHCMADGQLTPPDSPDTPIKPSTRNGPRLQLPRLLRRTKTDQDYTHMSVRRSSPVRPYVSEMKAPFSLRLPDSPIASDHSSSFSSSPVSAPELRRRSPTYHDLRSLAARQKEQFAKRADAPLLPSPIEKDDMTQSDSYFTFTNPRPRPTEYRSYQDLHILSHYEEREKVAAVEDVATPSKDIDQWKSVHPTHMEDWDSRSVSTVEFPTTPEDQIYQISSYRSNESGWLANETSWTQRERKFQARCFQVVQQPSTDADKDENVVRKCPSTSIATDLEQTVVHIAGPGKPKLVEISRPSSMSIASASRRTSTVARPQTPPRRIEVSAFSPYDTPYTPIENDQPMDETPLRPPLNITVPIDKHRFSTCSLVPAPLAPRSLPSTPSDHSSSTVFSSTIEKLAELSDPFGLSPQSHRTICTESLLNSSTATISTSAWPIPPRNVLRKTQHTRSPAISQPPSSSSTTQRTPSSTSSLTVFNTRLRRIRQTLSSFTAAINAFPNNILRLDSAAVFPVRNPHISDTTYTEALSKIFPQARPVLLSALAAWLIIDLWFEKTIMSSPDSARNEPLTAYDVLQSRHCADFWNAGCTYYDGDDDGNISSNLASGSINDQHHEHASSSPSTTLSTVSDLSDMDHFAAWDAAEHSNSALKRIPTKARSMLGISHASLLDEGMLRAHEAVLIRRMRVVRPSANVVGQKLVVALRGEWDEDVWRCLRVMVEVIEESPGVGSASPAYTDTDAPGPAVTMDMAAAGGGLGVTFGGYADEAGQDPSPSWRTLGIGT